MALDKTNALPLRRAQEVDMHLQRSFVDERRDGKRKTLGTI